MRNKTGVLSAAGVAATVAMLIPPSIGMRMRNGFMTGMRGTWGFVASPFKRKRTTRRPAARKTRKAG